MPDYELYFVSLDRDRLEAEGSQQSFTIAEALLQICGLKEMKEMPDGNIIYIVRKFPQDIPQAGIYWRNEASRFVFMNYKHGVQP